MEAVDAMEGWMEGWQGKRVDDLEHSVSRA